MVFKKNKIKIKHSLLVDEKTSEIQSEKNARIKG